MYYNSGDLSTQFETPSDAAAEEENEGFGNFADDIAAPGQDSVSRMHSVPSNAAVSWTPAMF